MTEKIIELINNRIKTLEANSRQCHSCGSHEKGIEFANQAQLLERLKKDIQKQTIDLEKITVKELVSSLLDLIEDGYGDHYVELSVNYNHCDHIQKLGKIYAPKKDTNIDWITLIGEKEK